MSSHFIMMVCFTIGSLVGSYIPFLWDGGLLASLIGGTLGSIIGIVIGWRIITSR